MDNTYPATDVELKPFGVEYLEPVEVAAQNNVRGGQVDEECCVTLYTYLDSNGELQGMNYCADFDMCAFE